MKQKNAVICADIVSSSSLSVNQLKEVQSLMAKWIDEKVVWLAERDVDSWGRVVRGDTLEFYMSKPFYGLRLALELRLMMLQYCQTQKQVPITSRAILHFLEHGMRVVVGVGEMRIHDRELNLMDGDALGQFEAIGFLIAAKSLLRFREDDTAKTEYVLVGTLLSFAIAILVGLLVKWMIGYGYRLS